jgi:hypothetical protein
MKADFDWRSCVLVEPSNAKFLRGETIRIHEDRNTPFEAIAQAIGSAFLTLFVMQFVSKQLFLNGFIALIFAMGGGVLRFRKGADSVANRNEAVLFEGELVAAKSDQAESPGTIITYRFISHGGRVQNGKAYVSGEPDRFSPGDKLVVIYSLDGTHQLL